MEEILIFRYVLVGVARVQQVAEETTDNTYVDCQTVRVSRAEQGQP